MNYLCKNCCKIFCENRDTISECNNKITYIQAGILDKPTSILEQNEEYNSIGMSFKELAEKIVKIEWVDINGTKED